MHEIISTTKPSHKPSEHIPPHKPGEHVPPQKPGEHVPPHKPEEPEKMITIFINGRPHNVKPGSTLSFSEIVKLAFGIYDNNDGIIYTVSYSGGKHSNEKGILTAGSSLKVKGGLIINVGKSTRS